MVKKITGKLDRIVVELAVRGINEIKDPSAQQEFDFELSMRPHIHEKKVRWDFKEHQLLIQVVTEGLDPQNTAKDISEELFEIAAGLLNEAEGMNVIILYAEYK